MGRSGRAQKQRKGVPKQQQREANTTNATSQSQSQIDTSAMTPATIRHLQGVIGNTATLHLLRDTSGATADDKEEQGPAPERHEHSAADPDVVMRTPGESVPATEENRRELQKRQLTPFGEYVYWVHHEEEIAPALDYAIITSEMARSRHQGLTAVQDELDSAEETVNISTAAPLDTDLEIENNATNDAVQKAETAENAKNSVELVRVILEDFHGRLTMARDTVRLTNMALDSAKQKSRARELRAKGERQQELFDTAITLLGAGLEGTVAVLTGGGVAVASAWWGAAKPAYDALTALEALFNDNNLIAEAEALEEEALAIDMEVAAGQYRLAGANLKHVSDRLGEAMAKTSDVEEDYVRQRGRAEAAYDASTTGGFRFSDVARAISLAELLKMHARDAQTAIGDARSAAYQLKTITDSLYNGMNPYWSAGLPNNYLYVNHGFLDATETWSDEAYAAFSRSEESLTTLQALRMAAHEALVNAQPQQNAQEKQ